MSSSKKSNKKDYNTESDADTDIQEDEQEEEDELPVKKKSKKRVRDEDLPDNDDENVRHKPRVHDDDDQGSVSSMTSKKSTKSKGKSKEKVQKLNIHEKCIEAITDYVKHQSTIGTSQFSHMKTLMKQHKLKNIQQLIEKVKAKIQKSKPVFLCEDIEFSESDLARFADKSYTELNATLSKHKVIIDMIQECLYRKDPKLAGYKKAISALNKLQSAINEENI